MTSRLLAFLLLVSCSLALAQPSNDQWASRQVIAGLPFGDTEPLIGSATVEATDPLILCYLQGLPSQRGNTVWYSFTTGPQVRYVDISTATSNYGTAISVFTGAPGSFQLVAGGCNDDASPGVTSRLAGLRLAANTAYSIEVVRTTGQSSSAATLTLAMTDAVVYAVNSVQDTVPNGCDAQNCTLREAITAANASPGAVLVPAGTYVIQRAGTDSANATGDFDIRAGFTIYGGGINSTVIDGADLDRVFDIGLAGAGQGTVIFGDLTISNGNDPFIFNGGGVRSFSPSDFVAFERVALRNNVSTGLGGGASISGRAQFRDCIVSGNSAQGGGGLVLGGDSSTLVEIRGCTISNNASLSTGGGIRSLIALRIDNSTVSDNRANTDGGGIAQSSNASFEMRSTTLAGNAADFDANGSGAGGGLRLETSGASTITNSLISGNIDSNAALAPDCSKASTGTLTTSYNLLQQASGGCVFSGVGDATGLDPALSPLADNGGITLTRAIAPGPAVDTGDPAGCRDFLGVPLATDQRGAGFIRIANGACDKGSFELFVQDDIFGDGFE